LPVMTRNSNPETTLLQQLADCGAEVERAHSNMAALLRHIGEMAFCRGCTAPIVWVRHLNGVRTPYNPDGVNHFITCLAAQTFKGKKQRG
jgi:hypothetical protein